MNCFHKTLEFLVGLGCCFGCKDENNPNEPSERTHLLAGSVNNTAAVRRTDSDDFLDQYPNSLPKKDEQSALTRIVQDTATNIIDVGAMEQHVLEQQEYDDRYNLYQHKMHQLWSTIGTIKAEPIGILKDISNPQTILASVPLSPEELSCVKSFLEKMLVAVDDIKVEHKEDLVVPFRIP